jgi:hypothetical protein
VTRAGWIEEDDHMGMLLCLAWHERQIVGCVVNKCPIQIINATPIKVKIGPTPKITHFDFNRILMFLMVIIDISHLIMVNPFIDPFLYVSPSPFPSPSRGEGGVRGPSFRLSKS